MKNIAFICKHDSSIKLSSYLAKVFFRNGFLVKTYIIDEPSAQNESLIKDYEFPGEIIYVSDYSSFCNSNDILEFDIVHIVTVGNYIVDLLSSIHLKLSIRPVKRPLFVTGLIGTLGGAEYHCYMQRQMVDLFYVGGDFDKDRLQLIAKKFGDDPEKIVNTGLPIYDGVRDHNKNETTKTAATEPDTILFAGQPTFPRRRHEREWVALKMFELAEKFPNKKFILKPRVRPGEDTIHSTQFHYEDLINSLNVSIPSNFHLSYENIQSLISRSDMVLTISSTAALEAIVAGKNVGFITDFGITEEFGNHVFVDSGGLVSFTQMLGDKWPVLNRDWVTSYVNLELESSNKIFNVILEKLAKKSAQLHLGQLEPYYYMISVFPFRDYYKGLRASTYKGPIKKRVSAYLVRSLIRFIKLMRKNRFFDKILTYFAVFLREAYLKSK